MAKRSWIAALVGVNLLLFALLVFGAVSLPKAFGQRGGGGGFTCVTAKGAGQNYDVMYILDQTGRQLYAYRPARSGQNVQYGPMDMRDLDTDFGK